MAKVGGKKKKVAAKLWTYEGRKSSKETKVTDIAKLVDHPLVTDLLAVGAMAAVSVIKRFRLNSSKWRTMPNTAMPLALPVNETRAPAYCGDK
jgi:hypothetical protein